MKLLNQKIALFCVLGACSVNTLADRVVSYTYNSSGQILTEDGPRSDVSDITAYTYDAAGNRTSTVNALVQTVTYNSYDSAGRLLSVTDANGITTLLTYNDKGLLLNSRVKHPTDATLDAVTAYGYDAVDNLISITLPSGAKLGYEYDGARRLVAIKNPSGERIEYTLDKAGNRTKQTIKNSSGSIVQSVSQAFDELSRIAQISGNNGQSVKNTYDANDNQLSSTDAKSNKTQQFFDSLNRVNKIVDPNSKATQFTYDAQNRIKTVTDARTNVTTYTYDGLGNLTALSSPDTGVTSFTYDDAGNRTSATDARGIAVNYTYDALNRLISVTYPASPSENVAYTYDSTANGSYGVGRLSSVANNAGTLAYEYNYLGLISKKTATLSGSNLATQYAYDVSGHVVSVTYPSGRIVNYSRDNLGRVLGITTKLNANSLERTVISSVTYLPHGAVNSYSYGNTLSHSITYDKDYRPTAIKVGGVLSLGFGYDTVDNIVSISDASGVRSKSLSYDKLNRLVGANSAKGFFRFNYDDVGNRSSNLFLVTTEAQSTVQTSMLMDSYTYEAGSNRLTTIDRKNGNTLVGTRSFQYDSAGNLIAGTSEDGKAQAFTFNNANRLTAVTVAGSSAATYTYNPLGQRVSKTTAQGQELYQYNESGQLIAVSNTEGTVVREYIYNGQQLVGFVADGTLYYVHDDHLGTPQVVTNQSQAVVWMANYEPFGKVQANAANSIELYSRFPGQYLDSETGIYYNYFRDYDPSIGRYIESDPIGLEGGINTYGYVEGNPMMGVDPFGLQSHMVCANPRNAAQCEEILPPPPRPVPKPKPQESCPSTPPPKPPKKDDDGCKKATDWQLNTLGITDPHSFKEEYVNGSISKYDICICTGGAIKIKGAGKCGQSGPSIDTDY